MREQIYLSERKLQQFLPGRPRPWGRGADVEGELKIPGLGGLKIGKPGQDRPVRHTPDLDAVISALDSSDRAAKWFTDSTVTAGQWVHFEAPLSYGTVPLGQDDPPVVFVDRATATDEYPTGGAIQLLLHGSSQHLRPRFETAPPRQDIQLWGSDLVSFMYWWKHYYYDDDSDLKAPFGQKEEPMDMPLIADCMVRFVRSHLWPVFTAAWMAGYARVSAVLPCEPGHRIVLATPLYVDFVSPPGETDF